MNDMSSVVPDSDRARSGIPLDLAPLLTPYSQYRRLMIRAMLLPPRSGFSKGRGNEDGSWSLTPEDLEGLEFLLPDDIEPPKTLAVRIIGIDRDENATIVGQLDVPLPARRLPPRNVTVAGSLEAQSADWKARMDRRVAAALRLGERKTRRALTEAEARWQAESEARSSEQLQALEKQGQEELDRERAAREKAEARTEQHKQKLTEVAKELEKRSATARDEWEQESEARVAAAVKEALAESGAVAKTQLEELRGQLQEEHAREAETLRQQHAEAIAEFHKLQDELAERDGLLSQTTKEIEEAWQAKLEAERLAREAAETKAGDVERQLEEASQDLAKAREEIAAAEAARVGQAEEQERADKMADARLAEQAQQLEQDWQAKLEAERLAREAAETKAGDVERRLDEVSRDLEKAREQIAAAEASQVGQAEEQERAGKVVEARLAEQAEQLERHWQAKLEGERLGREAAETKASEAEQKLGDLAQELDKAREAIAAAEAAQAGQADEETRAGAATEARLAEQAEQLEQDWQAKLESERLGREAAETKASEAERKQGELARELEQARQEIAAAEAAQAGQVEEKEQADQAVEARLAEQARQLEEDWQQKLRAERDAREVAEAEARNTAQRLDELSGELQAAVARAEAAESRDEAGSSVSPRSKEEDDARLVAELQREVAAAKTRWEEENMTRISDAVDEAVGKAETAAETRLEKARKEWQKESEKALEQAEAKWKAEETKRLATARAEWNKATRAQAASGRRKLRKVAKEQPNIGGGRYLKRGLVLAAGTAAAIVLYVNLGPAMIERWKPEAEQLFGDIETTARSQLESLTQSELPRMEVAAEAANLREGPSTSQALVARLTQGTGVSVLELRGDWIRIRVEDDGATQGWLHRSLLAGQTKP